MSNHLDWDASAEDFGQKVDLTVRIREILRNYPEGLSILKELLQNADDAGARTVRFCTAEQRHDVSITNEDNNSSDALSNLMKGPSLLAYNSAKFSEVDFKSIQQIGDSLKKDAKGTKTGRFGVGVNSTYHLTDVPMFVSGTKIVMFDPQATFVPGINPANPGKMVDCSKENGLKLVQSLPHVFDPLKVFGCKLEGENFNGTTFRFALRTKEQAQVSRLSRQSHPIEKMRELLSQLASIASEMLLFLKNVECIEIYDWKTSNEFPTMIHRTSISNVTENIRQRRSYVLDTPSRVPPKPVAVDYILDIHSTGIGVIENGGKAHETEKWMVCNQLGGGKASNMAADPELSHMKLVPWAGCAARLMPPHDVDFGNAYCFLPLPLQIKLPIHVNGYFELSSNRRDVWSGNDMAGDGSARALWNESIVQDIVAPSYVRLVETAIRTKCVSSDTYELLFPQRPLSGLWNLLISEFMKGIKSQPVLYSECAEPTKWVTPAQCLLPDNDNDSKLLNILAIDRVPLVKLKSKELKEALLTYGSCTTKATPSVIRKYFASRNNLQNGSLESEEYKVAYALHLLSYCLKDIDATQYGLLAGCQFIPLANGDLGKFSPLPSYDHNSQLLLQNMGFSKLLCAHSLRINEGNIDSAMEWLLKYRYDDAAVSVQAGIDPYLVCGSDCALLLQDNASGTFVNLDSIEDPRLKKFFSSGAASSRLNVLSLQPDMLADIVARSIPRSWRGKDSCRWNPNVDEWPNVKWFVNLWRFICINTDKNESLSTIAEQYCIVPTQQEMVCALSPGASVIDPNGLDPIIIQILVQLGVRIFYAEVFPKDLVIPKAIWSYVFQPTTDGIIKVIDTALRRENSSQAETNQLSLASDDTKLKLFCYIAKRGLKEVTTSCKIMLRNFPIFRTYCNSNSLDTKFVTMIKATQLYVLENATEEEGTIMTSDFLLCSNRSELELVTILGAKVMSRMDFFKNVVVPQLSTIEESLRNKLVAKLLLDLPSLSAKNPGFSEFVSGTKFIASAVTKTLKSPLELYDPAVAQLVSLMDNDSFPDDFFIKPDLLLSLRQLGLQSSLSWEVVLDCARSIEVDGVQHDNLEASLIAKARGRELLHFLDMNKESYFPEMKKKSSQSRTGMLFRKMNEALFQDSEEIKKHKQRQAKRVSELLSIKWMPVYNEPPTQFLPWPKYCEPVAAPLDTILMDKMWLASYGKRIVDGDVHSMEIKKIFGWLDDVSVKDVALQLRMMGSTFDTLCKSIETETNMAQDKKSKLSVNSLCQKISSEVGRIYHILNNAESEYEVEVMKSILYESKWLWMGNSFISSDHIAFTSSINATPYLFTVPPDLACFKNLLNIFNVRDSFGLSDFCLTLNRMAEEQNGANKLSDEKIELAITLVMQISDDILRLRDFDIYAPSTTGDMVLASKLVYDDAPWLSKDLDGKKDLTYAHSKLSASVCDKIGVQSVRKILLQSNTDMIKFGDTVMHEAFGQSESLTRRLKNIVEMYPEGPQQLSELIQNADDAQATVVKFLISKKQHGTSSLLGQKMAEWQGSSLYCYNNSIFTARDFQNLSQIGQASKLQKLGTTGRFGLGFNSVFHWTDVPSLVSGDYLVMFDPHCKYVPGATAAARGIKIRFSNTDVLDNFSDQMKPYVYFGNDMKNRFNGTLFRFPFRNAITGSESEISKKEYGDDSTLQELLDSFKSTISKVVLFLRNVKCVEVYIEDNDEVGPRLLYKAEVAERKPVEAPESPHVSGYDGSRNLAANKIGRLQQSNDWNAISDFISGPQSQPMSKEAFYSKLLRTPENQLPQTKHLVIINFVDASLSEQSSNSDSPQYMTSDKYLICSALGAGKCRAMACNPEYSDLKFLPWAGIAAHLSRNNQNPPLTKGNAFCFLPLPAETGFSVHLNGYFELSANRRDIWFGEDMSGAGKVRSLWNRLLLSDVVAPLYTQVLLTARTLLGPGESFYQLWPVNVCSEIWKIVRSRFFELAINLPLVYSMLDKGKWCSLTSAVFLSSQEYDNEKKVNQSRNSEKQALMNILLQERISIVQMPQTILSCMNKEKCGVILVDPSMVRDWFRKPISHPSLGDKENVVFLLKYCMSDLIESSQFHKLHGLTMLPLLNGLNGTIGQANTGETYYIPTEVQRELLAHASFLLVDARTSDSRLNDYLKSTEFQSATNVKKLDMSDFVKLLSHSFPTEWQGLPEIRWIPNASSKDASPDNALWISKLWDYIVSEVDNPNNNLSSFEDGFQIVPTVVGEGERTLQALNKKMAVVNISASNNDDIARILWAIGIRTLDTSVFVDTAISCRALDLYVHPPTARGIINALVNSAPEMAPEERNERMAARFQYLNNTDKIKFRRFLRDCTELDLNLEENLTIRSLPIYEVFALGRKEVFSHLSQDSCLPPSCAERNHLNHRFVKATSRSDVKFFESLGLSTMTPVDYYGSYLARSLAQNQIIDEYRSVAVVKMLQDIPELVEEKGGQDLLNDISNTAFVPNNCGQLVRPCDLYDPQEPGLVDLVDDSMLPSKELRHGGLLQTLRSMGMNTKLSSDGIIESAKRIEYEAKSLSIKEDLDEIKVLHLRKRAKALLNFLDDDETVAAFLSDVAAQKDNTIARSGEVEIDVENACNAVIELNSISWLPVDPVTNNDHAIGKVLPQRNHQLAQVGISSPSMTRPKADEFTCSKSMDILSITLKSDALMNLFKWNCPLTTSVVATQIVTIARLCENPEKLLLIKQHLPLATSQMYEILNSQIETISDDEREEISNLFTSHPWIWVGDRFVSTNQVALNAPENAKPFLYTVPDAMKSFGALLELCKVRDSFSGSDFVKLLSSLALQLQGNPCDSRQLDLAIFVSRHLSRVPHEELASLDKSKIFLPSRENVMHKARDMTFDDAPWLSAIVKRSKHVFVHQDIGNEVARILGSNSLRDVLSANQNGMVKIPCPKHDAIHQLLKRRSFDQNEMVKVVLELIEIAETKAAKQVSIVLDHRVHNTLSLLHPCLATAQGPSLVVCIHDVPVEVDELVKMTSPANYYSASTSGNGGCGGIGFPRFGRGLCGSFGLTDCLQVLSGRSFLIFDPNGEYFIEDQVREEMLNDINGQSGHMPQNNQKRKRDKASARNYGISYSFCHQFPDQFEPFLSLPYGFSESMINGRASTTGAFFRGTLIRIPFRSKDCPPSMFCDKTYGENELAAMSGELQKILPQTLLFTYHLQSVNFDRWLPHESLCQNVLSCRVGSSPLARRKHLEELWENKLWKKDKSKLGQLFKSSWCPLKTNHILQICSRYAGADSDIIDTYIIMSILAPPRLREMACTDSLSPLNLMPIVSSAAHIHQSPTALTSSITGYKVAEGTIFVGLPTGVYTGLPFHINAPVFLHEWSGDVMLEKDDDDEFKLTFPGIRNVTVVDKHRNSQTRSLALYVWNRQALLSSMSELFPSLIKEVKNSIHNFTTDHKLLYRFWPYYNRICPRVRDIMDHSMYTKLADSDMDIYLTENDGFKTVTEGYFSSPEYKLKDASSFFLQRMALFTTPKLVIDDLNRFGIDGRKLTPSVARALLRSGNHVRELNGRPRDVLAVLEYCLADLVDLSDFGSVSKAATICRKELMGLYIIPLADGTIGKFGTQIIIATSEQQSMLPIKSKFLWARAMTALENFLAKPGFIEVCLFQRFGPKTLSQYISTVLPKSWEGKNFVKWDHDEGNPDIPTKLWIYQFWKEVPISDPETVQLFHRWPLIPTKSGTLASCGNHKFILYVSPVANNDSLSLSLSENFLALQQKHEKEYKRDLLSLSTERRLKKNTVTNADNLEEFWDMGKVQSDYIESQSGKTSAEVNNNDKLDDENTSDDEFQDVPPLATDESQHEYINMETQTRSSIPQYDPNTPTFQSLYSILVTIKCPLLEASYFSKNDLAKCLCTDRIGVTRAIMGTLNQCTNYWDSGDGRGDLILDWNSLTSDQFDELLLFLSTHQGNRLSLMVSDLTAMKNLPLFETSNGMHVAISDRDYNFTLDRTVDVDSLRSYLPLSLQRKLLLDKPQFKDLYEDLNIRVLDEASILQQYILQEFPSMPIAQKEIIIQNILAKWSTLQQSEDLIDALKDTAFVKKRDNNHSGEIVFVKPNEVLDPRNELLNFIFDEDRSCFPTEEFSTDESLEKLVNVGLKTNIDKDTFLKCALIVEGEQSLPKALKLFEYFNLHFAEFYDNNGGDFVRNLAEVCCVPTADGLGLCKFRDAAAPKDRNLVFRVMPILHSSANPPQVMYSSLGIVSPPPISVVLRQLRALIEDESILDRWTYKHGSIEAVFADIFSFIQDNYNDLSPRVKEGLKDRPIVPVGTTLVKATKLFFRLAKDLSPFFYEVPRAFGAYDVLLQNLGVRDCPKSEDYALSLLELGREIGSSKLNINELKSVIEVVNLAASKDQNVATESICAPDLEGRLVNTKDLLHNDQHWLVNSRRLDLGKIHICHPKMSKELLNKLQIRSMSQHVHEVLDEKLVLSMIHDNSGTIKALEEKIGSEEFYSVLTALAPQASHAVITSSKGKLSILQVAEIKTRFILLRNRSGRNSAIDITNEANNSCSLCFVEKERILVSKLPSGVSMELVVSTALCDRYNIPRIHIGGITAILSSPTPCIKDLQLKMGLYGDGFHNEVFRGNAGHPLSDTDKEMAVVKPLKVFKEGEIIAIRSETDPDQLVYGTVIQSVGGNPLSRVLVAIGGGKEKSFLTSDIFAFGRSNNTEATAAATIEEVDISCIGNDVIAQNEEALVNDGGTDSLAPVKRSEILTAIQDLLHSADMSLKDDAKKMLASNLSLQEALSQKERQIQDVEKRTNDIIKKAKKSVDSFLCPITREMMIDPVICCDGHTYEKSAIEMWLRNNSRSPKTNQPLASRELIPNHALRNAIETLNVLRASIVHDWEEEE